jgi:hypothetical protein
MNGCQVLLIPIMDMVQHNNPDAMEREMQRKLLIQLTKDVDFNNT